MKIPHRGTQVDFSNRPLLVEHLLSKLTDSASRLRPYSFHSSFKALLYHPYFLWAALFFCLQACANPLAPTGGPRDETPPAVVDEDSSPNFQTNFEKQRIELTFDEWVQVSDIFQQVVVSPPLDNQLDITLRKRTVRVDFADDEVLKEDVTYTINFGEAIKDLTERNPAENLRFVFSTGDFLDSLTISGTIIDAQTAEPKEDIRVMLYENLSDTVVRTERPFYFAKTDKLGKFKIENVKEGTFRAFALEDGDLNYLFNQANEAIGFPDTLVAINGDTSLDLTIRLFTESQPYRIQDVDSTIYGLLKVNFSENPEAARLDLSYDTVGQAVIYEFDKDTLKVWYDQVDQQNWSLYIRQDTLVSDTIPVRPGDRGTYMDETTFKVLSGGTAKRFKPSDPISLNFNQPIGSVDTALLFLYEDTLRTRIQAELDFDTLANKQLRLKYPWREGMVYALEILPGAITDMYGLNNQDSIVKDYQANLYKNYGNLNLTLEGFDSTAQYIMELLGRSDVLVSRWIASGSTSYQRSISNLSAAKYTIRIITDVNRNGRWDTGEYDTQRQPEPIYTRPLEDVRANWDVEATVRLGEKMPEPERNANRPENGGTNQGGRRGSRGRN
ncbi:MAG: Ig-like domain-containing protein [Saprospiraceae bacterium]|nr:Ig-like domain-containing protein [Saprospiraceae bacterium]